MSRYELTETIAELLDTEVKERSVNAMLRCPFHEDRHPSFSIHLNEGLWYCFSCGEKGNLDKLFRIMGEEMSDDIRQDRLIRSLHSVPEQIPNFAPLANRLIRNLGTQQGQHALERYVAARPICRCFAIPFGMGYSPERDALAFPYWDDDGATVTGIKYRLPDGSKRAETTSNFGIYAVENARGKRAVLVAEGESDTQAAWTELRYSYKLGVCGISGAKHDARTWELWALDFLFAERVYLALDADEVGDEGYEAAKSVLGDKAIRIRPFRHRPGHEEKVDLSEHILAGGTVRELGLEEEDLEVQRPTPNRYLPTLTPQQRIELVAGSGRDTQRGEVEACDNSSLHFIEP